MLSMRHALWATTLLSSATALITSSASADLAKIYWAGNDATINRANLDGSNIEQIVDLFPDDVQGLEIDAAGRRM